MKYDKTIAIKRKQSEVREMPEFLRHIAETGSYTRAKALELGILKTSDWGEQIPEIEWIDRARGDGHRDFSCICSRSLHEKFSATFLTWCVTNEEGEVLLKSSTWREGEKDYVYV